MKCKNRCFVSFDIGKVCNKKKYELREELSNSYDDMWRNDSKDDETQDEMILITIRIFHGVSHNANVNYKMQ